MLVIVGESSSGKSSVAKYLMEHYGFKRIVTYTTRPPRKNEVNGVDYNFVNDQQFLTMLSRKYFAETASYNGWLYGSAKKDYDRNSIAVLTPKGLRTIKRNGIDNIISIYIDVPRRDRLIKCLERGDDIEEAYRRNLSDVGQFDGIEYEVDFHIENPNYKKSIEEIGEEIIGYIRC